jgi:hypothetical protein
MTSVGKYQRLGRRSKRRAVAFGTPGTSLLIGVGCLSVAVELRDKT